MRRSRQALGLGERDVVLAQHTHQHAAHADGPGADFREDDRGRGQRRVIGDAPQGLPVEAGREGEGIAAAGGEDLQHRGEDEEQNEPDQEVRDGRDEKDRQPDSADEQRALRPSHAPAEPAFRSRS